MVKKKETMYLEEFDCSEPVPLQPEDWEHLSQRSLQLRNDRQAYEASKKNFADLEKGVKAELDEVTQIMACKKIYKAIKAKWCLDFSKNEKRLYQILGGGELVYLRTDKITDADRQLPLVEEPFK